MAEGTLMRVRWVPLVLQLLITQVALIGFVGCYSYRNRYTLNRVPTGKEPARPPTPIDNVEIILNDPPGEPHSNFALLEADTAGKGAYVSDTPRAITMLKEAAAKDGADGVHSVKCAAPGTVAEGACTGIAFVYKK
jgi:hypothetical protein